MQTILNTAISDIMSSPVDHVTTTTSLRHLIELLTDRGYSGVPVVDRNQELVGVVSATDVVRYFEETEDKDRWLPVGPDTSTALFDGLRALIDHDLADRMPVKAIMSDDLCVMPRTGSVRSACAAMVESGVHRLMVIDSGELVGIVTATDLLRFFAEV